MTYPSIPLVIQPSFQVVLTTIFPLLEVVLGVELEVEELVVVGVIEEGFAVSVEVEDDVVDEVAAFVEGLAVESVEFFRGEQSTLIS